MEPISAVPIQGQIPRIAKTDFTFRRSLGKIVMDESPERAGVYFLLHPSVSYWAARNGCLIRLQERRHSWPVRLLQTLSIYLERFESATWGHIESEL